MFRHRKVSDANTDGEWSKLRKTVSPEVAYKAAEVIGAMPQKTCLISQL